MKAVNLSEVIQKKETGFFIETNSPFILSNLDLGEYEIVVRAYDQAMNWQDASEKIEIFPAGKLFYTSKSGISILTIFLAWRQVLFILISLVALIFIVTYRWRKNHKYIYQNH